jgi:hypothetical protein
MKLIDDLYFENDFSFTEDVFHGVKLFCDGKHIYQDKVQLFHHNAIGKKCEECESFLPYKDYYFLCSSCREKKANENYLKLEIVEETPHLYSDTLDEFFDSDDFSIIHDYLSDMTYDELMTAKFEDLRVHPCEDYFPATIDIANYFEDAPEDFEYSSYSPSIEIDVHVNNINRLLLSNSIGYQPDMKKRIALDSKEWEAFKQEVLNDL